jgi:hypothetical protein
LRIGAHVEHAHRDAVEPNSQRRREHFARHDRIADSSR